MVCVTSVMSFHRVTPISNVYLVAAFQYHLGPVYGVMFCILANVQDLKALVNKIVIPQIAIATFLYFVQRREDRDGFSIVIQTRSTASSDVYFNRGIVGGLV